MKLICAAKIVVPILLFLLGTQGCLLPACADDGTGSASSEVEDPIGVHLGLNNQHIIVTSVTPGSVADTAGLKANDEIYAVDSAVTYGRTINDVLRLLRGSKGNVVMVTVRRDGDLRGCHWNAVPTTGVSGSSSVIPPARMDSSTPEARRAAEAYLHGHNSVPPLNAQGNHHWSAEKVHAGDRVDLANYSEFMRRKVAQGGFPDPSPYNPYTTLQTQIIGSSNTPQKTGSSQATATLADLIEDILRSAFAHDFEQWKDTAAKVNRLPRPDAGDSQKAKELDQAGFSLYQKGDFRGAAEQYSAAVVADPANALSLSQLALAEINLGDLESAKQHLYQSLLLVPDHVMAWLDLEQIFARKGDKENAIASILVAHQISPAKTAEFLGVVQNDPGASNPEKEVARLAPEAIQEQQVAIKRAQ